MNKDNEQREIKFRAWDTRSKQMSDPFSLFGEFLLIGGVHAWQEEGGPGDCLSRLNHLIVMQCTGLQDWNEPAQEIYESDIVLCDGKQRTIKWANGKFWFVAESSNQHEDISEIFGKYYGKVKRVGHIYSSEPIVK